VRVRLCAIAVTVAACSYNEPRTGGGPDAPVSHPDAPPGDSSAPPPDACTDNDHDGICDDVDTWLCGATMPSSPGSTVNLESGQSNLHNVDFGSSMPRVLMAMPGQSLRFSFDWGLQVGCPQGNDHCEAEIEYGIAGVGKVGCAVDINIQNDVFTFSLGQHANLNAPTTPAVYDIRAKVGLHSSGCGSDWYNSTEPDSSETIAIVCVPPQ
jgi:hypothetical protein